jgi:hypothetical protein
VQRTAPVSKPAVTNPKPQRSYRGVDVHRRIMAESPVFTQRNAP